MKKVNGDMTKIRYVPNLSRAAQNLLQSVEHTSRRLPGTQEARRNMRFDLQAMRIMYGVPIFVTFSPDEGHNMVMLRLSRTRRKDPVNASACVDLKNLSSRHAPALGQDLCVKVPVESLLSRIPNYDTRMEALAKDPLASVDGFRMLVLLAYRYLFGMNVCPRCPDCNNGKNANTSPCQDVFGSSATEVGGIFGRGDAGFTSIEAQKSTGSLHAHSQIFIQCMHQHNPLHKIFRILRENCGNIMEDYLRYHAHVQRQTYAGTSDEVAVMLKASEQSWPAHREETFLISQPAYQRCQASARRNKDEEAADWYTAYIKEDVERLQAYKQHHMHVWSEETGEQVPLPGCRRKDKPKECKSNFPRTAWLWDTAVVLCKGFLAAFWDAKCRQAQYGRFDAWTVESRHAKCDASCYVGRAKAQ